MLFSFLTHPFPHPLPYPAETWRLHFSCEIFPSQLNFWILMTEKSCQGKHLKPTPTHFTTFESVSLTNAHKKKKNKKNKNKKSQKQQQREVHIIVFPGKWGKYFWFGKKLWRLLFLGCFGNNFAVDSSISPSLSHLGSPFSLALA